MLSVKQIFSQRDYRKLLNNILNLFFFQGTNYLLPLITIPYIVRVIGPEKFGILSFAEVLNRYFVMITEYGFNVTGTQQLSIDRDNYKLRNKLFNTVSSIRLILMLFCFGLLLIILTLIDPGDNSKIFFLYFLIVPGNLLLSYWFYLGMEEMHFLNYPNMIARIGYAVLIFVFLTDESKFYLVPVFYGITLIIAGLISFITIIKRYKIIFSLPSIQDIWSGLRNGWHIFISTFAINLYRRSNVFILGLISTKTAVGYYSAGEKIIVAIQSIFSPVIQAFYPFVSRKKTISSKKGLTAIRWLFQWLGGGTIMLSLLLIIFAKPSTILILGNQYQSSISVMQIASLVICFGVLNYILGIIFMTNYNYEKQFSRRVIITGVANIFICSLLSYYYAEIGTAVAFVFSEFLLLILLVSFTYRHRYEWMSNNG
jgi:PST family polysaccharide transporter